MNKRQKRQINSTRKMYQMGNLNRKNKATSLRGIKNAHYRTEITLLELSTYHNIFVTAA